MKKKFLWIIFIVVLAGALWTYRGSLWKKTVPDKITVEKHAGGADGIQQQVMSFVIDGRSAKGAKQWRLEADYAEIKEEEIHLTNLEADAYGEETTATLTSDRGIYYRDKGEIELMGNVKCVSDNGSTLTTEKARWSQVTNEVTTDDIVHIDSEGMRAVGRGGMANSEKRIAMLMKEIEVMIEPGTKVTCNGPMEVDQHKNIAVFYDNVIVEDKDGKLFTDKLTVEMNPETRTMVRAIAEGNVRVKKGNHYTVSEKGIYSNSTKSIKLLGRPRVVLDPGELDELEGMRERAIGK